MPVEIVINAIKFLQMLISPHRTDRIGKRESHVNRVAKHTKQSFASRQKLRGL